MAIQHNKYISPSCKDNGNFESRCIPSATSFDAPRTVIKLMLLIWRCKHKRFTMSVTCGSLLNNIVYNIEHNNDFYIECCIF